MGWVYAVHFWGTQSASHVGAIIHWRSAHNAASLSVYMMCGMFQVGFLCLLQNSNSENPNCTAIEGVLEAYFQSLRTVQLYGPTNFAPVINQVAR